MAEDTKRFETPLDTEKKHQTLEQRIDAFFQHHTLSHPPSIAVAVSGGRDSMALALLMNRYAHRCQCILTALTVDHRLRRESADEARQVSQWMQQRGIAHEILHWQHRTPPSSNIQQHARTARYRLLTDYCRQNGIPALLLGHQQDDQAETLLLNLQRGSGVDGLAAMPVMQPMNGITVLRPLLYTPRHALKQYLQQHDQPWLDDPSNDNPRFTRSRLRDQVLPTLEQHGFTPTRLAQAAQHIAETRHALDYYTQQHFDRCVSVHPAGCYQLDKQAFFDAPIAIVQRLLRGLLMRLGSLKHPPRRERLQRLLDNWQSSTVALVHTLGGCVLQQTASGNCWLFREAAAISTVPFTPSMVWDGRFLLQPPFLAEPGLRCEPLGARRYPAYAARLPADWPYYAKLALPLVVGDSPAFSPHATITSQNRTTVNDPVYPAVFLSLQPAADAVE